MSLSIDAVEARIDGTEELAERSWFIPFAVGAIGVALSASYVTRSEESFGATVASAEFTEQSPSGVASIATGSVENDDSVRFLALAYDLAMSQTRIDPDLEALVAERFGDYLD